jgi:hypothetical protein
VGSFRETSREGDLIAKPFRVEGAKLHEKWGDYEYNEDLQEDLFLERVFYPMPVQNTFIHYRPIADGGRDWLSSPSKMLQKSFHTIWPNHESAHNRGECKPCAYHLYKTDGCRWGNDCQFCHLCKRGELKKRKKERAKSMREAREARARALKEQNGTSEHSSPGFPDAEDAPEDASQSDSSEEAR